METEINHDSNAEERQNKRNQEEPSLRTVSQRTEEKRKVNTNARGKSAKTV